MKKLILIPIFIAFIYLCGAFFSVSFDIAKWQEGARFAVVIMSAIIVFVMISIDYLEGNFK